MFDPPDLVDFRRIPYSVVQSDDHAQAALKIAQKTVVLLQNDGVLPLRKSKVFVVGPNADNKDMQWGNYNGFNWGGTVSILDGIRASAESVEFLEGCDLTNETYLLDLWPNVTNGAGKTGYDARFWPNADFSGEPTASQTFERIRWHDGGESSLAGDYASSQYSARFTGVFNVTEAGVYTVRIKWRNRLSVKIGNVFSCAGDHPRSQRSFNITVNESFTVGVGELPIEINYTQTTGEAVLYFAIGRQQLVDQSAIEAAAARSDVVVFIGGITAGLEGEEMTVNADGFLGGDRTKIELPKVQREVLEILKGTGKKVVFVLCAGSAMAFNPDGLNAVVDAFYPGQAGGTAVADVLYGRVNPAGRLPITFYRRTEDLPPFHDYNMTGHTYRFFKGDPLYPFGHGLSYTTFEYGNLSVQEKVAPGAAVRVEFDLVNTGGLDGEEVAQAYVKSDREGEPIKSLKWFTRVEVKAGARTHFAIDLPGTAFEVFDEGKGALAAAEGAFRVAVGGSSADNALIWGNVTVAGDAEKAGSVSTALIVVFVIIGVLLVIGFAIAIVLAYRRGPAGAERLQ
jgi:beta-glucosidase